MKMMATALALGALSGAGLAVPAMAASPTTVQLEAVHPAMQQILSYGDTGHWVMTLQADLNQLGYSAGPVDGVFGPKTEAGLKAFQSAHQLPVTGETNPVTWQDILSGFGLMPAASVTDTSSSVPQAAGPAMIDGRPVLHVYHMLATAYGPSLADNYPYGPTDYFGQPLEPGMVAVDPSVIPLKSTVYVTGYQDAYLPSGGFLGQAMDTGGAIQGMRIDIYMDQSPSVVSNFGIQPVTVYVLGQ